MPTQGRSHRFYGFSRHAFLSFKRLLVLLFCLSLTACKKNAASEGTETSLNKNKMADKIDAWFNGNKTVANAVNASKITALQQNLDYGNCYMEAFRDNEQFVIVPIGAAFKSTVNTKEHPTNYLLVILDDKGAIRRTDIVQFIADDGQFNSMLPKNTFADLFIKNTSKMNGRFYFLNFLDKLLWEIGFKDGKQVSLGYKQKRQVAASRMTCTAWFLVTTYNNGDGTTFDVEEYLYTTCDNQETENELDPRTGGEGGGGEYNDDNDPPINMVSDQTWTLEDRVTNGIPWKVTSTETLTGKKYQYRSAKFETASHKSSQLVAQQNFGTWHEGTVDVNLNDQYSATAKVDGDVIFSNNHIFPYNSRNRRFTWISWTLWK